MSKHSPGPWELGRITDGFQELNAFHGEAPWARFACVAVMVDGRPDAEGKANARLIAAAPELLEALGAIVAFDTPLPCGLLQQARAAIAKAEGGAQ
jgi:hypothetical protein